MISAMASAGALSVLLDLIPVTGGLLLLISFIRRKSSMQKEEKELRDIINALKGEEVPCITHHKRKTRNRSRCLRE